MPDIRIFAAGSLRGFLKELSAYVKAESDLELMYELGPSGVLKNRIIDGERPDLFLSATLRYPVELEKSELSTGVNIFACNEVCLFGHFSNKHKGRTEIDWMLDPGVRLGTSTPGDDPGGDYAFEVFKKIDKILPGSYANLSAKAHIFVGGRNSVPPPVGVHPVLNLFQKDKIDIFLGYYTSAMDIQKQMPGIEIKKLPTPIKIKTRYAFTRLSSADPVMECARCIQSEQSKSILSDHGFCPV